jgi:hypothetical protein
MTTTEKIPTNGKEEKVLVIWELGDLMETDGKGLSIYKAFGTSPENFLFIGEGYVFDGQLTEVNDVKFII